MQIFQLRYQKKDSIIHMKIQTSILEFSLYIYSSNSIKPFLLYML